ncbi:MAG TPA: TonB-dependent receptor [Terriglobia bacterium]|nr:TonB-dependent receptor [Terriglobia bacterium]
MRFQKLCSLVMVVLALILAVPVPSFAQVNTADLSGQVLDPSGAAISGAKVTANKSDTGATRSTITDASGSYLFIGLPPGNYEIGAEASGFRRLVTPGIVLTVGQAAQFNPTLQIAVNVNPLTVTAKAQLIETQRTSNAETVSQRQINNLPINGRNYINFTLLDSQVARDSAPSIGAAPTSGLNFGGQRARSNQVSVDGADAGDNSTNGIRSTVSQEDVQEFQLIISNYMPEFGRATGGVVNIVTKGGSNAVHGDVFGFLRSKYLQARNPFSVQVDPTTGAEQAIKQAYTRVQAGATLGGPIRKDRTFYFLSFETTRRHETGFTNIGANNFGLTPTNTPFAPFPLLLTPQQAAFVTNPTVLTAPGGAQVAAQVAFLAGSASNVALNGVDYGAVATGLGVPSAPGARFPLPIDCNPFAVPSIPCAAQNLVPLPGSYVPLKSLIGNYPIFEGTSLWSARLDHAWNQDNHTFVRVSASPSLATGSQVNAQNETFGQNAGSRASLQQYRDVSGVVQNTTTFGGNLVNEARFQFARRGLHYGYSQLPGGSGPGVNITGFAFFGREPFSTVDRIERRWQFTDDVSWIKGHHNIKFGPDVNLIQVRSKKQQIFELNFGSVFNFGSLSASDVGLPDSFAGVPLPGMTAVQSYGLGLPEVFIQGIGNSNKPFDNTALGFFVQDSWKIHPRVTLNYGIRYDVELTPVFTPATALNVAAEKAFGVLQGIPRDNNNWAPRVALAWDPTGQGTTVIRAGAGLFFDHPLLAVAFDSNTADGAESSQLLAGGGVPTRASVLTNPTGALNAASIFQGVLNAIPSMGYLPSQQRFNPLFANSLFTNQNFMPSAANPLGFPLPLLPFTLPTASNFVYSYAEQGNFAIEHSFANDYKISASYSYTHGLHLNRPRNINVANPVILTTNFRNALASGLNPSTPLGVGVPANAAPNTCVASPGGGSLFIIAPGALATGFAAPGCPAAAQVGFVGTPAFFNFFRPSGPNPSFAGLVPGGYATEVALAGVAGYPVGFAGVQVPWSDVDQQESSGMSIYHGLTVAVSKRFSNHFEFQSGWTWSHAIDDSTDLQTLLTPQDDRFANRERSNSSFDQRHRWITSAVFTSPFNRSDSGFAHKFLADFTVAPVVEISSGRPFTVLTGTDYNLNFSSNTDRPSIGPVGVQSPYIPGVHFTLPTVCDQAVSLGLNSISPPLGCSGNLGRNTFTRPGFAQFDLRVSRTIPFRERWNLEIIADAFNLFNRFNVGDVNPVCDPTNASACLAGQPTAALDPRTFQLALKINW